MVWLWGVNLWVFAQSSVSYAKVFDLDHTHLTHWEIWKVQLFDSGILIWTYFQHVILYFSLKIVLFQVVSCDQLEMNMPKTSF